MAYQKHLDILNQGVEMWNKWRKEHPDIQPDLILASLTGANLIQANLIRANLIQANLTGADLTQADLINADLSSANLDGADLSNANLSGADLAGAYLRRANLSNANLRGANFSGANLTGADLTQADLINADLSSANLDGADLIRANLKQADFIRANLKQADLIRADLRYSNLSSAKLDGADLSETRVGWTIFGNVDLRSVKGLETVHHHGPSTIGIDTIIRSQGKIPEIFLRSAGVPPSIIEAIPSLVGSLNPIDFYSCFISYSSKDQDFAERVYADLQSKGVRCWYAPYDLKTGDKWRDRIEESIRLHDKLLLVLSHSSIESPRVEEEVVGAQEKEERYFREIGVERLVLFPIRLDEAVMKTSKAWAANLRRLRHIGDFHNWKQHDAYQKAFTRLLRDLKAEAQKMGSRDAITNDS